MLQAAAGDDWPQVADRPEALEVLADLLRLRAERANAERPAHYTRVALCQGCGPVFLWPEAPEVVRGCPWCLVRHRVLIPRPLVTCATCRHFEPNGHTPTAGLDLAELFWPGVVASTWWSWSGLRR